MEKLVRHSVIIASLFCGIIHAYDQAPAPRQMPPQHYSQQSNQNLQGGYGQFSQQQPNAPAGQNYYSSKSIDFDDNDFDDFDDNDADDDADEEQELQARYDAFKLIFDNLRSAKLSSSSFVLEYELNDGKKVEVELPSISTDLKFEKAEGTHIVRGTVDAKIKTEFTEKNAKPTENQATVHGEGSLSFSSWESLEQFVQNPATSGNAHFKLDLSKFTWSSDYTSYQGKGLISFVRKEGNNVVNYVENSTVNLTSKYDEFLKSLVRTQIEESDRLDIKSNIDGWLSLVPRPSTWGEIKNEHDMDINFNLNPIGDPVNLAINVKKSRVTVGSYGLDWNLNLTGKQNFQDLSLNATINVMNYKSLIDELAAYANRWITVSNKTAKDAERVPLIGEADKTELVNLLKKLSANPTTDTKDWLTSINYNAIDGLKIGTLNGEQVAAEWNRVWGRLQAKFSPEAIPGAPAQSSNH